MSPSATSIRTRIILTAACLVSVHATAPCTPGVAAHAPSRADGTCTCDALTPKIQKCDPFPKDAGLEHQYCNQDNQNDDGSCGYYCMCSSTKPNCCKVQDGQELRNGTIVDAVNHASLSHVSF